MNHAFKRQITFGPTAMRRVIRRGSDFICGVCRQAHHAPATANACLRKCWASHTAVPVVAYINNSSIQFRCQACHREYGIRELSEECARECLSKLKVTYYTIPNFNGDPTEQKRKRLLSKMPIAAVPMNSSVKSQQQAPVKAGRSENIASFSSSAATKLSAVVQLEAVVTAAPPKEENKQPHPPAEATPSPRPPKDRTKKFFRDGARYVCVECSAKFFTKDDVEACWEAHP